MKFFIKIFNPLLLSWLFIIYLMGCANGLTSNAKKLSIYEIINKLNANVIFVRHALAPGIGDPENFELNDCSKQRNLDSEGKKQAEELGNFFRDSKLTFYEILSSEWCRCKETSSLLKFGSWKIFSGLNSFFDGHVNKEETLKDLKLKLDSLKPNTLVLMVTHQVNISAITGKFVSSGGIVIYNSVTGISESFEWSN